MPRQGRIYLFVAFVTATAALSGVGVFLVRQPFPGWWPLATFLLVASLLESLNTDLRLEAKGSTSFIMHMACTLLFAGWWAALIAASSTLLGELARKNRPVKILFNISQRITAVSVAALVYSALGGKLPPSYLGPTLELNSQAVQRDLGLFFILAFVYFIINTAAVNTAIVLSSGRAFREVWNLNTRGILAYDLSASIIGVLVAWLYTRFDLWLGFGSLGLLGVI